MNSILTSKWTKAIVFVACLVPLALLVWRGLHDDLSADPVAFITHATGDWTLRFLVITLAITPLRKILHMPQLIRFRRMLGLFAFFYVCLHFTTWIWLDKQFVWSEMWKDVEKRRFITVGMANRNMADRSPRPFRGGCCAPRGARYDRDLLIEVSSSGHAASKYFGYDPVDGR